MTIKELPQEGYGLKKIIINDEWDFKTAGGCANFGMHDKNPAFVINILDDSELQVRLKVLSELSPDGSTLINNPDNFNFCVNCTVYRIPIQRFPVLAGSIELKTLVNPALTTNGGKYSNNLSAIVSERVRNLYFFVFNLCLEKTRQRCICSHTIDLQPLTTWKIRNYSIYWTS